MKVFSLAVVTAFAFPSLAFSAEDGGPKTYEARYEASAVGLNATAYRTLSRDEAGLYTLENSLTLTLLGARVGSVTETSQFHWEAANLIPLLYRYEQTGVGSTSERVEFDWQAGVALSVVDSESWTLPLEKGIMDKLSYSISLGQDLEASGMQEFSYDVVDGDEIETHLYRVTTEEVISTSAGDLNAVKIERIRDPESRRRTTVWLAKDWDYLLVRLEQVSSSGRMTELNLESATVDSAPLVGL